MEVYVDLVALLNFAVDFLLLVGTNRLSGHPPETGRAALAAALGGLYGGLCLIPGFRFLGNFPWRLVVLGAMAVIAFGCRVSALRRGVLFVLLSMALGGAALGIGRGSFGALVCAALGVAVLAGLGMRGRVPGGEMLPVELWYDNRRIRATALRDTGNTLRDPVTGQRVLVAGADVAEKLTGLSRDQLAHPVETLAQSPIPGLRLIPYRAVGQPGAMLLAMRCKKVKIGNWEGSLLVAFAPEPLGSGGTYQLLMGGALG